MDAAPGIFLLYALGVAIGGSLLTALTGKIEPKKLLLLTITVFVLGSSLAFFAHHVILLQIGKVITGSAHGVFFVICRPDDFNGNWCSTGYIYRHTLWLEDDFFRRHNLGRAVAAFPEPFPSKAAEACCHIKPDGFTKSIAAWSAAGGSAV